MIAATETGSNILTTRKFGPAISWTASLLMLTLLLSAYGFGLVKKPESLLFAFAVSLPLLVPALLLFITTSRVLFGRKPVIVVDANGIRLPKLDICISRDDVAAIRYEGHLTNNKTLFMVDLKHPNKKHLRCNLLIPIVFATSKRICFSIVGIAEGSERAKWLLMNALSPSGIEREKEPEDDKGKDWRRWPWQVALIIVLVVAFQVGRGAIEIMQLTAKPEFDRAAPHTVTGTQQTFDPSTCATDAEGSLFIALGRTVLRLPVTQPVIMRGMAPAEAGQTITPPNPGEPKGCSGNPVQQSTFKSTGDFQAPFRNVFDRSLGESPLLLVVGSTTPDHWHLQHANERTLEDHCRHAVVRRQLPNGMTACHPPSPDDTIPLADWAVSYRADPQVYSAPFGRPFVVTCMPFPNAGPPKCQVGYKIFDTLSVRYFFRRNDIPIDQIIAFDRELRERIAAVRVADFVWPDDVAAR